MTDFVSIPNTFYRVSLKALIKDSAGHVLVVKEESDAWSLPGGGLDHGESVADGLKRELFEEAAIVAPFTYRPLGVDPIAVRSKQSWLMWVVFEITLDEGFAYGVGEHTTEVAFIHPNAFKDSVARSEQLVYSWSNFTY